jgi:hypothetical protein
MRYAAIAMIPLFGTGCFLELMGATAIQSTLQAEQAGNLAKTLESAKNVKSDIEVNHAIQAYAAEFGQYPASLNDLVPSYFTSVPVQPDGSPYGYDPQTGTLHEAPLPAKPAGESDAQKIQRINKAINQYGTDTGYYPGDLSQLVPFYISELPTTNSGETFVYDSNTGIVSHPNPAAMQTPARPAQRGAGAGGGSPMVEAMTGIGIQQELGNMNNAGTNAAGTRARGNVDRSVNQHNQLQEQVLDQLP